MQMLNDPCFLEEFDTWRASGRDGDIPRKGHEAREGGTIMCSKDTE